MTDSTMKKVATPVLPRKNMRRTWLNAKGHVVKNLPVKQEEPAVVTIEWEAKVVDCATDQVVDAYPSLAGTLKLSPSDDQDRAVTLMYMDRCRFLDGAKPDVEELQQKVNGGIWDVDVNIKEPVAEPV